MMAIIDIRIMTKTTAKLAVENEKAEAGSPIVNSHNRQPDTPDIIPMICADL